MLVGNRIRDTEVDEDCARNDFSTHFAWYGPESLAAVLGFAFVFQCVI